MNDFNLIRNADVKVKKVIQHEGGHRRVFADVAVNGEFEHRFPHTSRISKHLDLMEESDLANRLTGGSFFFIEDELVDFRDGGYNGFVHTDESVKVFMDILGYQRKAELAFAHVRKDEADTSKIVLRKVWNENEISVPGYQSGGDFTSQLSFVWNPYVKTINSAFDLVRLICTNGMVGVTSFLNTKIPLFNRWEEHLDIASRQIQNKVNSTVIDRIQSMSAERASVADCLLLEQHAFDRLYAGGEKDEGERERLFSIMAAVNPRNHLSDVYQPAVFDSRDMGAQLPAHLSAFDAFNVATELRSHTAQTRKSSDFALDKLANQILFDREDNFIASASRYTMRSTASFADTERAFYGVMDGQG